MFIFLIVTQVIIYGLTLYYFVQHGKTGKHKSTFRVLLFFLIFLSATLLILTGTPTKYPINFI
ncbi:hypothetical protein Xish_03626 [Xenorhabdus ishibashii]|uniref:Uncharacterized protein n=1 Tax=Xenorhabdus ishibashii TaxID=1034471 RepID=A0A2D0K7T7_9GAMM|nr:hypothetical protein Xish_03626 [Xenorhabdus ishibashii]